MAGQKREARLRD